jgi:hypothetical protein
LEDWVMSRTMEEFYAIRDAFRYDDELFRLASLVGTDAKNPKRNLADYIAGMVMSHRESVRNEYEDLSLEHLKENSSDN